MRAIALATLVLLGAFDAGAMSAADRETARMLDAEADRRAPADYGYGPGVKPTSLHASARRLLSRLANEVTSPGPEAHDKGVFGTPVPWPIIPIHVLLLPDGRVLAYGTDEAGAQGAQLIYDIWDPSRGTDAAAHLVLANTTTTDIFCSAQTLIPGNGEVLITGGDRTVNGQRNFANDKTTIFDPVANDLRSEIPMSTRRWYPSVVALPSGEVVVLGGRGDPRSKTAPVVYATTPEIFDAARGWRRLDGAPSEAAFGPSKKNYFYPRAFLAPDGNIVVVSTEGSLYALDPSGNGSIATLATRLPPGRASLPTVMYAPGRLLSIRYPTSTYTLDLNVSPPVRRRVGKVDQLRHESTATVMADGRVFLNGGSVVARELEGAALHSQIWDPATGRWRKGATAQKVRLYHSSALLLQDGTVLTAGGGTAGPVNNLNGEIYYPPYLFDANGEWAPRPRLTSAPSVVRPGETFEVGVEAGQSIGRTTLVRAGSATHGASLDQRFQELRFTQVEDTLRIEAPGDVNLAPPGFYLLFAFDRAGTPSEAKIVQLVR